MTQTWGQDLDFDTGVIGGGVVGLSIAARRAQSGKSVVLLERHDGPGHETSSRNSEVLHAGIYYPPGSLKAQLCVRGRQLLLEFCQRHGVDHRLIGKLIIAFDDGDLATLHDLQARGEQNGVRGLGLIGEREIARLEPAIRARQALFSPHTGIIDSHGLLKALEAEVRAYEGTVLYQARAFQVEPLAEGYRVHVENPSGKESVTTRCLVNAAGLWADTVAAMCGVDGYRQHLWKGQYFSVSARHTGRVARLIYPTPAPKLRGLGIHITLNLQGGMRLGPDATYLADRRVDYAVDESAAEEFCAAVGSFFPGLTVEDLRPDTSGIRPKLQGPNDPWMDFSIVEETSRARPGLVNLVGIDSPGLTSCLAIAEHVERLLKESTGS